MNKLFLGRNKMIKRPVRNLHSDLQTPPRIFDVIVEDDNRVYLEQKSKDKYLRIPWDDVVYQVEAAKEANK